MTKLTLETAKKMYLEGGAGKDFALDNFSEEELTKKELPKYWSDLGIEMPKWIDSAPNKYAYLWYLEQYMKAYNGDWVPDWTDCSTKWCIRHYRCKTIINPYENISQFLAFKSEDLAEQFLENFKDLIETAKPLL